MKRLLISLSKLSLLSTLAIFATLTASAQVVGGTLSGTVTDNTGAALANAAVLVHNDETGNERRLTTSATMAGYLQRPIHPYRHLLHHGSTHRIRAAEADRNSPHHRPEQADRHHPHRQRGQPANHRRRLNPSDIVNDLAPQQTSGLVDG